MSLRERFAKFKQDGFAQSVSVLVGGTAFSQALMVLALPLLTRLYSPDDFSILAVYVSLLGTTSVAACLRLEVAIPIPERDEDAANLLALALFFGTAVATVVALLVFLIPDRIISLVGQPAIRLYLWLLPVGVLLSSSYSALQFWSTRKKAFPSVAMTRMTQALGGVGTQVAMGWAKVAPFGLLLGHMISSGAGVISLGRRAIRHERNALSSITARDMRRVFREYDRYPKYSTFEAMANTAGIQLPILIIAALAIGPEAGFLMLAMRVMQVPLTLVGSAISQVYLSRAADHYRDGNLDQFTTETLQRLMKTGVGPLIFSGMIAPQAFTLLFGEDWRRAGELVCWMTPWFILQFVASPISMVMLVQNRQRGMLMLTFFGLTIRVGAILLAVWMSPQWISEFYAISGAFFYSLCLVVFSAVAGIEIRTFLDIAKKSSEIILSWSFAAIIISLVARYLEVL